MPTIRTRAGKGARLTNTEIDTMHKRPVTTVTEALTVDHTHNRDVLSVSGTTTITLTAAATVLGAAETGDYGITVIDAGADTVTVARSGSDTISGATSITLAPGDAVTMRAVSGGYRILDWHRPAYYLARSNHTGTQAPATISPQGASSGLDADTLDGVEGSGYALAAAGVTNGNSHDHAGGDGAQIPTAGIADQAVTDAKLVQFSASTDRLACGWPVDIPNFTAPVGIDNRVVKAAFLVLRGGSIATRVRARASTSADDWRIRWFRRGSSVGDQHDVTESMANYDNASVTVSAGDYLECSFWRAGNQSVGGATDFVVEAVELRASAASLQGGAAAIPLPVTNTGF